MSKAERLRRAIVALEEVLEGGRWPTGLELTIRERDTIRANLEGLREELRRLEGEG